MTPRRINIVDLDAARWGGWRDALCVHGLHDCTVRNDGWRSMIFPVAGCLIELAPGEQITLRSVEA